MLDRAVRVEHFNATDSFVERTESEFSQVLTNFLSNELKEVNDELWFASEA